MEAMIRRKPRAVPVEMLEEVAKRPHLITRELNNRSLFHFMQYFWSEISPMEFVSNWHLEYLAGRLESMARRVSERKMKYHDLIINIPPGTTKTTLVSVMFPAWCWSQWYWMKFITASYSLILSLEAAELCRDLIRSERFQEIYPEIGIKENKDQKSNYRIIKKEYNPHTKKIRNLQGGGRFTTSVGATITGFHGDILLVDDPINPKQAASDTELAIANRWMEESLPTRKTDKTVTPTILIMQRLHQIDPTGFWLGKKKENIHHICIPGEAINFRAQISPPELYDYYVDDLMDPKRLSWTVLKELEADLGQYGYAGQVGQNPTPPGGGMFKIARMKVLDKLPDEKEILSRIRYWDKAGTQDKGAYTVGALMAMTVTGHFIIEDIVRGRWGTEEREQVIWNTAHSDGREVVIWLEQEPGSGGKESAEATLKNLAGFAAYAERPTGDKIYRADPYSVQVNNGNVSMVRGKWNDDLYEEHRFFPYSTFKDQIDACSGAFNKLAQKRLCRRIT